MKILWTDPSIEDLRNLHSYIAKDSEVYAGSFVERIVLAVEKLTNFPRLGRVVPEAEKRDDPGTPLSQLSTNLSHQR